MSKTRTLIIFALSAIFLLCGVRIFMIFRDYHKGEEIYETSREAFVVRETPAAQTADPEPERGEDTSEDGETEELPWYLTYGESFPELEVDFETLLSVNEDIVGWLWIPDTDISYPLLLGADNAEYIHTTYDGSYNSAGSIFMDYRCSASLEDVNTVIFGHNMKNGTMFGSLKNFEDGDYLREHRDMYIITPECVRKYRIYASYVTENGSDSYTFEFPDEEAEAEYRAYIDEHNCVETDFVPHEDAPLVMLSTCTSGRRIDRFVVHAALVAIQYR